jgi:hypothetical protein
MKKKKLKTKIILEPFDGKSWRVPGRIFKKILNMVKGVKVSLSNKSKKP